MMISITSTSFAASQTNDIFLSKGEQTEIEAKSLKSYSIGNKEVLKSLLRQKNQKLLIKAKSIGFSDLIIWHNNGLKTTYRVYVVSKKEQLQKMQLLDALKETQLQVKLKGDWILINGEIDQLDDYQILQKALKNKNYQIISNVKLSREFKNKIIKEIYLELYDQGAKAVQCHINFLSINCEVDDPDRLTSLEYFEKTYAIRFSFVTTLSKRKTYEAQLKIFSLEKFEGELSESGFAKIEGELGQLIQSGRTPLETENFKFQNQSYKYQLLATPSFNIIINEKFDFKLGQEIPIAQSTATSNQIDWKFTGIKIQGIITQSEDLNILQLTSQVTAPTKTGSIQGPSNKTSFHVKPDIFQRVFKVNTKQIMDEAEAIPLLNQIPLLGKLFKKSQAGVSSREIYMYIKLTEVVHE